MAQKMGIPCMKSLPRIINNLIPHEGVWEVVYFLGWDSLVVEFHKQFWDKL